MRLASSSFMYQGETMGSGISWDLYAPAKFPLHLATLIGKECGIGRRRRRRCPTTLRLAWTRARSDIKSARATYGPAKFIREILNIPRRTDGKRRSVQHGRSWCPFIGLVAALLSRQRVTSTVRSCAIVGRVCQARLLPDADGSFAIKNNSLTKT